MHGSLKSAAERKGVPAVKGSRRDRAGRRPNTGRQHIWQLVRHTEFYAVRELL